MHGTDGVVRPAMGGAGRDIICQTHLLDPPKALKPRVGNDVKNKVGWHMDESIHRVIDDLLLVHLRRSANITFSGRAFCFSHNHHLMEERLEETNQRRNECRTLVAVEIEEIVLAFLEAAVRE